MESLSATAEAVAPDTARINVLCVDDDSACLRILTAFLRRAGHSCHTAGNGAEALRILRESPQINLVITDVVMPEVDGHELCSVIAAEFPEMKVIVVSGSPGQDVAPLRRCSVVQDVLSKPLRQREIVSVVHNAISAA
ncbi:MAG TPA: hypothetical protein DEP45_05205 [Armatimonadetes bacterium]|nr:hypothetical protein [Armatimonadota bacterium]